MSDPPSEHERGVETSAPFADDDPFQRLYIVGLVVERFALLESTLRRTAWLLLFADPVAAHVLTVQESAQRLIELCRSLITEAERKGFRRATPDLVDALEAAKGIIRRRNDLLHNVQMPGENFSPEVWKQRRGQDRPIVIPAGLAEMRGLWLDTNDVINRLMQNRPNPPFEMPPNYV